MHTMAENLGARLDRDTDTGELQLVIEQSGQGSQQVPMRVLVDDLLNTIEDPYVREAYAEQFEHLTERFHAIAAEG